VHGDVAERIEVSDSEVVRRRGRHAPHTTHDLLAEFGPPITALRWITLAVGLGVAAPSLIDRNQAVIGWALALAIYAAYRTLRPIVEVGSGIDIAVLVIEVAVHTLAVVGTGYWESPFILSLVTAVVVGGFSRGFGFALQLTAASILAIGLPLLIDTADLTSDIQVTLRWSAILLLVAIIVGYADRLFGHAALQHSEALGALGQLLEANELLSALNRVAQTLPASLDDEEVVNQAVTRLRSVVDASAIVIIRADDHADDLWHVLRSDGTALAPTASTRSMPPLAQRAASQRRCLSDRDTWRSNERGFSPRSRSLIHASLESQGRVVGILGIESDEPNFFSEREVDLIGGFRATLGVTLENARLFTRLRAIGAEMERTRIARDLHDRVGQSLAYLAFELDRLGARAEGDLRRSIEDLRTDVRTVVSEVRETLHDLRTDVADGIPLEAAMTLFLERVERRSGIATHFQHEVTERPPFPQERELWRIGQEAVANAERHANPSTVSVWWRSGSGESSITVTDDGDGFTPGVATRMDSYGMVGMRERADAIGGQLTVDSAPGRGTSIRCSLRHGRRR